jgi:glycosyltransferase involved in cell wall biosynthesis
MTIDILMATYNGGKYLEAQIFSLLGQTYKDWNLYIHDDGSSDNTVSIIQKFKSIDNRIKFIEDGIKFKSAGLNFFHLLQFSNSPFVIFCDQDDIWLENKIELLVEEIKKLDNTLPQMVFAGGYLYSQDKDIFQNFIDTEKPNCLRQQLFLNAGLQGCSIIFNDKLKNIATQFKGALSMHDHLITLVGISFGKIKYLERKLMLYRQNHSEKSTASIKKKTLIDRFFIDKFPVIDDIHFKTCYDFYNTFQELLNKEDKLLFEEYFKYYYSKSKIERIKIVVLNKFSIDNSISKLIVKTLFRA